MTIEQAIECYDEACRLEEQGDLARAAQLARQALETFEREEGPASPDLANVACFLGTILEKQANYQGSLECAERACAVIEPLLPLFEDDSGKLIFIHALTLKGKSLCQLGRYIEAMAPLEKGAALAETLVGAPLEAASVWNELGVVCKYAGWFSAGEKAYAMAMLCVERADGDTRLIKATVLHNIGGIRHASGDFAAAESPSRLAWELRRAARGQDHMETLADAVAYAGVLDGLLRYAESRPIYERALAIYEERVGPGHFEVAATLHNLAYVYEACGELEKAIATARRALSIKQQLFGAGHPETALTAFCLATLLREGGGWEEPRNLALQSLAVFERNLDPSHPHIAHVRTFVSLER